MKNDSISRRLAVDTLEEAMANIVYDEELSGLAKAIDIILLLPSKEEKMFKDIIKAAVIMGALAITAALLIF